jgi:class 3 adenylate cyclase
LVKNGAKVDVKDRWGSEPLKEAILHGDKAIVDELAVAGAIMSTDLKAELEMSLRHYSYTGNLDQVKCLVGSGFFVNAADYMDRTALHIASENGHDQVVDFLISSGADIDHEDKIKMTALDLAKQRNHFLVKRRLEKAGFAAQTLRSESMKIRWTNANFAIMEAFPQKVARAMLHGEEIEPIQRSAVSLLYSDIVGFTSMSSRMDPAQVSRLLNRLFRKFDRLAHLHGVQKVDIVGDAYIAAANLLEDQPDDHAARLARFALDILAAARALAVDEGADPADAAADGGGISLRVGLHCGPVAGSVVAPGSGRYTLVGDTVLVAAAMEATGEAGRVQCSEDFAALVAAQSNDIVLHRRSPTPQHALLHTRAADPRRLVLLNPSPPAFLPRLRVGSE